MSRRVLCTGCGFRLELPDDYKRSKAQCPECGIICEVPPEVPAPQEESRAPPPIAPALDFGPAPTPRAEPPQPAPAAPVPAPPVPTLTSGLPTLPPRLAKLREPKARPSDVLACDVCGELVCLPTGKEQSVTCPCCGSPVTPPAPAARPKRVKTRPPTEPAPPPVAKPTTLQEEWEKEGIVFTTDDDGKPYPIESGGGVRCPACKRLGPKDSVVCTGCGYDFRTGAKPTKTYTPYSNQWEIGLPLARRRKYFLIVQAVVVTTGLFGAWLEGSFWAFLIPWVLFTLLAGFLLGTYERIELSRTARGVVRLALTWRVCFLERPTRTIRLREYEGVATGMANAADFWDWFILVVLFFCGIVPAVLWYYMAIHRATFFVALTKDHGFPEQPLCRTGNEQQVRAIAKALHEVAELPYAE